VISAFARAGKTERAEELLEEMYSDYLDGNDSAKPNVISFSAVLDAWSKSRSRDAPQRAEAILECMAQLHSSGGLDTKPNIVSYNSEIDCWAKSSHKQGGSRCGAETAPNNDTAVPCWRQGSVRPDKIVFETVILTFMQAGQANRAKELCGKMRSTWK
jgi:hypothetical protein